MAQQTINLGTGPDDNTGDHLRSAFTKVNDNFDEMYDQVATGLPLTTKGDLYGFDSANTRVAVGVNDYVLTADSTTPSGLAWKVVPTTVVNDLAPVLGGDLTVDGHSIITSDLVGAGTAEPILISAGSCDAGSFGGTITVKAGDGENGGYGGHLFLHAGNATVGVQAIDAGDVELFSGTSATDEGGFIHIIAGDGGDGATFGIGGEILITAGSSTSNQPGGDIVITPGTSAGPNGNIILDGLNWPQADGTADYVLKTDGAGQLSWTVIASTGGVTVTWAAAIAVGTGFPSGAGIPAMARLNSTDVAVIDTTVTSLRTYRFNGSTWFQVGNSLVIATLGNAALAGLNSTDVAFADDGNDELRTYRFDGTNWAIVGTGLALTGTASQPSLTALNGTDVAYVDNGALDLITYRFNGTNWAIVGNGLTIAGSTWPALTTLNSTDVAIADTGNDELRTYRFDGTNWAQVGVGLALGVVTFAGLTALSGTDIAYVDGTNDELRTYRFDGTNWAQVGGSLAITGAAYPTMVTLTGGDIALVDSTDSSNDDIRTYRFPGAIDDENLSVYLDGSYVNSTGDTVTGDLTVEGKFASYEEFNTQIGTTYPVVADDVSKMITMNNAVANTATIPANTAVAFPIGTKLNFMQLGTGQTTIAITTDTLNVESTLTLKLTGQYAVATALKVASTSWVLFGNLEAV